MTRNFADLHLRVNCRDSEQTSKLASKVAELGYKLVALQLFPETRPEEILQLKKVFNNFGLDFASRVDLRSRSQNELLSLLRKLRRKFEIICVLCENKEVARQAAKDRRVDLLNFPLLDYRKRFFDQAEAELAANSCAGFEIDLRPLLVLEGPSRVRLLSCLRREVNLALSFNLAIVLSSGVSEARLLRRPRELALLSSLFGLEGEKAFEAVSDNPFSIVERNRKKLSDSFVCPGIRVIKEGGDF
jgi:ribonuclease P/MRP protein subunit RPP1